MVWLLNGVNITFNEDDMENIKYCENGGITTVTFKNDISIYTISYNAKGCFIHNERMLKFKSLINNQVIVIGAKITINIILIDFINLQINGYSWCEFNHPFAPNGDCIILL